LEQVVGSGGELLKAFFQQCWADRQEAGGSWDNADRFRGVLVLEDEAAGRHARFSVVSPLVEDGAAAGWRFGVENESAKLNLGALLRWEQRDPDAARRALMNLPGMTTSIADALLDWIDPDSQPRPLGAEADYYRGLGLPYGPRNGVPQCLEELLLVRGVTRGRLFGGEASPGLALPPAGRRAAAERRPSGPASGPPWAALLTGWSAERNETLHGRPRIDLNRPDLAGLHQRLAAVFERPWADFIVLYRQYGPYTGAEPAVATMPAINSSLPAKVTIESPLDLVGAKVRLGSGGPGTATVVASPLPAEPAELREKLPLLVDTAAVTGAPVIEGKINVNLSPRPVLLAVPGIDAALADRILVARAPHGPREDTRRLFPTWLLTEGLVDLPRMKALWPYLTGGGDVVRAHVIGYYDELSASAAAELVIDAASNPPRQIYGKVTK
jgi:hypothetical protein